MWKQGREARSSDESKQTVLKPAGPGSIELFFVLLIGGEREVPSRAVSRSEWGPRHQADFLKVQVQQLPGTLAVAG